ncbi:MAG: hypothetical protein QOG87_1724 [Actinomycetota bacterium]|jgi:hypothetical protein
MNPLRDQLIRIRLNAKRYLRMALRHPRWLVMFVASRVVPLRLLGLRLSPRHAAVTGVGAAMVHGPDPSLVVAALERDGFCAGLVLAEGVTERFIDLAARTTCYANADRRLPFKACPGELPATVDGVAVAIGDYIGVETSAEVRDLAADPLLLEIASRYLHGEPHLLEARVWWSVGTQEAPAARDLVRFGQDRFHFDLDDWRCINLFFHLSDVDEDAGPHTVVRGSHRRRRLRDQLSPFKGADVTALTRFYGEIGLVSISGPAGSGFASDPFAFHMGRRPRRDRLILKLEFGCGFRGRGSSMVEAHRQRRDL